MEDANAVREADAAYADNVYERVLIRQMRDRVSARVAQLPERESLVVHYHYFQKIPFDEIADMLGVTKGRVSQIHRKALTLLRQSLGEEDGLDVQL